MPLVRVSNGGASFILFSIVVTKGNDAYTETIKLSIAGTQYLNYSVSCGLYGDYNATTKTTTYNGHSVSLTTQGYNSGNNAVRIYLSVDGQNILQTYIGAAQYNGSGAVNTTTNVWVAL